MSKIMASLLFRGNAYIAANIFDNRGFIQSLYVCNPDEVSVNWDKQRLYGEYIWRDREMTLNKDFFHIAINRWPGDLTGVGPIEASRRTLEGVKAEGEMYSSLMDNFATPPVVITADRTVSKTEADDIREIYEGTHGGDQRRPAVLSKDWSVDQLTINPVDLEFIAHRNFSVQEVARIFGLHGFFLLVESGSSLTYSTTESLFRLFLTGTLRPTYLERIEQVFSLMLPRMKKARFDINQILQADIESRYKAYQVGLRNQFLTVEEVRTAEHMNPTPTGTLLEVSPGEQPIGSNNA